MRDGGEGGVEATVVAAATAATATVTRTTKMTKSMKGMSTPRRSDGRQVVRTRAARRPAGPSKNSISGASGARSNGTPSAAGPLGVAADSASVPAPPGVSPSPRLASCPDWKIPQPHTRDSIADTQLAPMRPNQ